MKEEILLEELETRPKVTVMEPKEGSSVESLSCNGEKRKSRVVQTAAAKNSAKGGEKRPIRSSETKVKVEGADGQENAMEPPKKGRRKKMTREDMCVPDDGYRWLQYGKKPLLDSRYSRFYYRCAMKRKNGCPAKKTVDCCQEDIEYMKVAYEGQHNHEIPPQTTRQVFIFRAAGAGTARNSNTMEVQTPPQSPHTGSSEVQQVMPPTAGSMRHMARTASVTIESGKNVAWTPEAMERAWSESAQAAAAEKTVGVRNALGAGLGAQTPSPVASPRPLGAIGRSWSYGCGPASGTSMELGAQAMPRSQSGVALDKLADGGVAAAVGGLRAAGPFRGGGGVGSSAFPAEALSGLSGAIEEGEDEGSDEVAESQGSAHQHVRDAAGAGCSFGRSKQPAYHEGIGPLEWAALCGVEGSAGSAPAGGYHRCGGCHVMPPPAPAGAHSLSGGSPATSQSAVYISYTNHVCFGPQAFYASSGPHGSLPHAPPAMLSYPTLDCYHHLGHSHGHVPSPLRPCAEHSSAVRCCMADGPGQGAPMALGAEHLVDDFLVSNPPDMAAGGADHDMLPAGDTGHGHSGHHDGEHGGGHGDEGGAANGGDFGCNGGMDLSCFHDLDYGGGMGGDMGSGGPCHGGDALTMFGMEATEGCDPLHEMQDHHFYGNDDFQPFAHLPGQYDPYWRGSGFHHR